MWGGGGRWSQGVDISRHSVLVQVVHEVGRHSLSKLPQAPLHSTRAERGWRGLHHCLPNFLGILSTSCSHHTALQGLEVVHGVFIVASPDAVHQLAIVPSWLVRLCHTTVGADGSRISPSTTLLLLCSLSQLQRLWDGCHVSVSKDSRRPEQVPCGVQPRGEEGGRAG